MDKSLTERPLKRKLTIAARLFVSGTILYFLFSLVQWQNVLSAYHLADGRYIAAGAILLLGNLGIRTLKWQAMLNSVKNSPTLWEAFGSVMLGIALGSFTPGEIGEFAGRALHITDARRSHLVGLTLLDKAQIFIITCASGIISLIAYSLHDCLIFTIIVSVTIIFFIILFLRLDLFATIGHHLNTSFFQKQWLTRILDGFCLLKQHQLLVILIYTIAFHGVLVLQMFCLINAFSKISLLHAFIGTSAMMFVKSLLPISLSDLGIREASSIIFFSSFGISQAAALNASLLLFFINVFIPGLIGTFFFRHQSLRAVPVFQLLKKKDNDKDQC